MTGTGGAAEPGLEGRSFEELEAELEQIVARLERGDVAVDEAIALWQRGAELHRACVARLDAARGRIEELARGEQGTARGGEGTGNASGAPV